MSQPQLFDKSRCWLHHLRAMKHFVGHDFMFDVAVEDILGKLADSSRNFEHCLEIGGRDGRLGSRLQEEGKIAHLTKIDSVDHPLMLFEGEILPCERGQFDLIISPIHFHWANDLLGVLIQCFHALKKDGVLIANLYGGSSLTELRQTMLAVESEGQGAAARIIPMVDVKTLGSLLARAGFSMVVTDAESFDVEYSSVETMMHDLRGMGETHALKSGVVPLTRSQLAAMDGYFKEHFQSENGMHVVTAEILTLTGIAAR